jgi:hypothetical protein
MAENEKPIGRDIRFCPFCYQMSFEMSQVTGSQVFCEVCGVEIEVKDLVEQ